MMEGKDQLQPIQESKDNLENLTTPTSKDIETQESKDKMIEQEAEKLKTNVDALKQEIEEAGGEERFKRLNSEDGNYRGLTKGGANIEINQQSADAKKKESVKALKTGVLMILGALGIEAGMQIFADGGSPATQVPEAIALLTGITQLISAVNKRLNSRKDQRESERMKLKMAMTDTPTEFKV